jgi:lipoprotein-anchoring transpeptidase ErfK/SrfK
MTGLRSPTRRALLAGMGAAALSGCVTRRMPETIAFADPILLEAYGPRMDEPFPIQAVDITQINPRWLRQVVPAPAGQQPGTIVVDPGERHLYLVREDGTAMRYGVGVGREGFGWSGDAIIRRKAEWPTWTPPAEMMARQPDTAQWANGMPGGLDNPLGARAFYLYQGNRDTLYRIHGTNEPRSIGRSLSSGCIRLFNQDIIDLYQRVPVGTRVVVRPTAGQWQDESV